VPAPPLLLPLPPPLLLPLPLPLPLPPPDPDPELPPLLLPDAHCEAQWALMHDWMFCSALVQLDSWTFGAHCWMRLWSTEPFGQTQLR